MFSYIYICIAALYNISVIFVAVSNNCLHHQHMRVADFIVTITTTFITVIIISPCGFFNNIVIFIYTPSSGELLRTTISRLQNAIGNSIKNTTRIL